MFEKLFIFDHIQLFVLIAINFIAFFAYLKLSLKYQFWLLPFSIYFISYLINYPLKAVYLMYFADVSYPNILFFYDSDDLIGALAYATVYFIVFVLCTTFLIRKYLTQTSQDKKSLQEYMPYLEKLLNILVFIIVIITLTKH